MLKRRVLAWLFALFFGLSSLCSGVLAVETLDDMDIDPWGDLGIIQETPEPTPSPAIQDSVQLAPVDLELAGEGGASVFSLPSSQTKQFSFSRFGISRVGNTSVYSPNSSATQVPSVSSVYVTSGVSWGDSNGKNCMRVGGTGSGFGGYQCRFYAELPKDTYESISLSGYLITYSGLGDSQNANFNTYAFPEYMRVRIGQDFVSEPIYLKDNVGGTTSKGFSFNNVVIPISSYSSKGDIQYIDFCFFYSEGKDYSIYQSSSKMIYSKIYWGDSNFYINYQKLSVVVPGGDDDNPGSSSADDDRRHEETKGLLGSIIQFLQNIVNGIGNIGKAIAELPGKIVTALIDGLKSLFIPSEEDLNGLKDKYEALLSERLGFIWQAGEWITSFAGDLLTAITSGEEAEFVFPGAGFDMNGQHYQLIEEQPVDFSGNAIVQIMRPVFGTIVAFIVVTACVNLFHDMVTAFVSGKSYFDFLKGGGGE